VFFVPGRHDRQGTHLSLYHLFRADVGAQRANPDTSPAGSGPSPSSGGDDQMGVDEPGRPPNSRRTDDGWIERYAQTATASAGTSHGKAAALERTSHGLGTHSRSRPRSPARHPRPRLRIPACAGTRMAQLARGVLNPFSCGRLEGARVPLHEKVIHAQSGQPAAAG